MVKEKVSTYASIHAHKKAMSPRMQGSPICEGTTEFSPIVSFSMPAASPHGSSMKQSQMLSPRSVSLQRQAAMKSAAKVASKQPHTHTPVANIPIPEKPDNSPSLPSSLDDATSSDCDQNENQNNENGVILNNLVVVTASYPNEWATQHAAKEFGQASPFKAAAADKSIVYQAASPAVSPEANYDRGMCGSVAESEDFSESGYRRDQSGPVIDHLTAAWREDVREKLMLRNEIAEGKRALAEAQQQAQQTQEKYTQQVEVAKLRMRIALEAEQEITRRYENSRIQIAQLSTTINSMKRENNFLTQQVLKLKTELETANATVTQLAAQKHVEPPTSALSLNGSEANTPRSPLRPTLLINNVFSLSQPCFGSDMRVSPSIEVPNLTDPFNPPTPTTYVTANSVFAAGEYDFQYPSVQSTSTSPTANVLSAHLPQPLMLSSSSVFADPEVSIDATIAETPSNGGTHMEGEAVQQLHTPELLEVEPRSQLKLVNQAVSDISVEVPTSEHSETSLDVCAPLTPDMLPEAKAPLLVTDTSFGSSRGQSSSGKLTEASAAVTKRRNRFLGCLCMTIPE